MNDVRMVDGVPMARGTEMNRMSGYTTMDTPTDEDLYCEFEVDGDGDITLRFQDRTTANLIAEMVLGGGSIPGIQYSAQASTTKELICTL